MKKSWIGLAATGLVWLVAPTCIGNATPVAKDAVLSDAKRADLLSTSAREALAQNDAVVAVRDAEAAVVIQPNDAAGRALLGRAYLAAGRFASADTAFGDALTLDPTQTRLGVTRALAQIALGQTVAAQASLAAAAGTAPEADIGLALALLGHGDEARDRLMAAARAPGADARVRQNLAFAYALEGRWNDAATVAAQDVPADKMADRLRRWAMVAQLKSNPAMQIGALLGVLPANSDEGQPQALALVAQPAAPIFAEATVPTLPAVMTPAPAAAADEAPAETMAKAAIETSPAAVPFDPTTLPVAKPAPAAAAAVTADAAPLLRPASVQAVAMLKAPRRVVAKPIMALAVAHKPVRAAAAGGKWAVQLGAFSTSNRTQAAWTHLSGRARFLTGYMPTGSGLRQANATLHRLAISGLATRADATRLCLRIKAAGGACFVRESSGDRPMIWALRERDRGDA